jgi:hypothetical protein
MTRRKLIRKSKAGQRSRLGGGREGLSPPKNFRLSAKIFDNTFCEIFIFQISKIPVFAGKN